MSSPFDPGHDGVTRRVDEIYAAQTWPLLPAASDLHAYETALLLGPTALQVLLLGVTPSLYRLPWPHESTVRAVDRSPQMVQHVWPGSSDCAHVGEWSPLPYCDATFDRVVTDGGLAFLGPSMIGVIGTEVARVLRPGGLFVARVYVWNRVETMGRIMDDIRRRAIETVNEYRIRSWSALQTSTVSGVSLQAAYDAVVGPMGSLEQLVEHSGLEPAQFLPFQIGAHSTMRYTMWDIEELVDLMTASTDLEFAGATEPEHRLGHLCPVLAFRRS